MEIKEIKERMCKLKYNGLRGTAACVMRGVEKTSRFRHYPSEHSDNVNILDDTQEPYLYFGDSLFGSAKAAVQGRKAGHHACFSIKTAHARSSKKYLDEVMNDYLGGTWIIMEWRCNKEDVDLICIEYT